MICAGSYTSEVGVTKERTPDAWQEIKAGADQLARDNNVNFDFPFTPIAPGDRLSYGGYDFEVISLAGHTSGQCGLVERNAKLFFCADQVILGLVPIVITSGKDQHLLTEYFASLRELASVTADTVFSRGTTVNSQRSKKRPTGSSPETGSAAHSSVRYWQKVIAR